MKTSGLVFAIALSGIGAFGLAGCEPNKSDIPTPPDSGRYSTVLKWCEDVMQETGPKEDCVNRLNAKKGTWEIRRLGALSRTPIKECDKTPNVEFVACVDPIESGRGDKYRSVYLIWDKDHNPLYRPIPTK